MPSFGQWCQLLIIFSKRFSHSCYGREYFRTKFKRIIAFLYASLPINLVFFHCRSIWRIFIPTTFRWGMEIILTFKPKVRSVHWNKWSSFCIVISDLWIIWQNSFVVRTPSSAGLLWCSMFCWGPVVVALWGCIKMAGVPSFRWSIMAARMRWCILLLAFWRTHWLMLGICLWIVRLFQVLS